VRFESEKRASLLQLWRFVNSEVVGLAPAQSLLPIYSTVVVTVNTIVVGWAPVECNYEGIITRARKGVITCCLP
jgi:hypothetical protein